MSNAPRHVIKLSRSLFRKIPKPSKNISSSLIDDFQQSSFSRARFYTTRPVRKRIVTIDRRFPVECCCCSSHFPSGGPIHYEVAKINAGPFRQPKPVIKKHAAPVNNLNHDHNQTAKDLDGGPIKTQEVKATGEHAQNIEVGPMSNKATSPEQVQGTQSPHEHIKTQQAATEQTSRSTSSEPKSQATTKATEELSKSDTEEFHVGFLCGIASMTVIILPLVFIR